MLVQKASKLDPRHASNGFEVTLRGKQLVLAHARSLILHGMREKKRKKSWGNAARNDPTEEIIWDILHHLARHRSEA